MVRMLRFLPWRRLGKGLKSFISLRILMVIMTGWHIHWLLYGLSCLLPNLLSRLLRDLLLRIDIFKVYVIIHWLWNRWLRSCIICLLPYKCLFPKNIRLVVHLIIIQMMPELLLGPFLLNIGGGCDVSIRFTSINGTHLILGINGFWFPHSCFVSLGWWEVSLNLFHLHFL